MHSCMPTDTELNFLDAEDKDLTLHGAGRDVTMEGTRHAEM